MSKIHEIFKSAFLPENWHPLPEPILDKIHDFYEVIRPQWVKCILSSMLAKTNANTYAILVCV